MSEPLPVCFLNGAFLPLQQARISPLDRAFLFGDAVYEVIPVYGARPFRLSEHLQRLDRSLQGIRMQPVMAHDAWAGLLLDLLSRNAADDAALYLQVTRGVENGRNHVWAPATPPTIFAYCSELEPMAAAMLEEGVAAVTAQETRWARRDIKSTALLANVLLKKLAADAGAFETIMLENGELTEGSSTTVHIVKDGVIYTPPNGRQILPGTTRDVIAELAEHIGIATRSVPVKAHDLQTADEIWLAFSTRGLLPVTSLDAKPVGRGRPGEFFARMHAAFTNLVAELAATPAL